ncbi:GNAT family N-acetyltransferase [Litchfieldia salsa]|uniref:Acetyltransferase (GNAT) family protein n=1 Tax=Litchfieldia salsa TaxID=930152 RepID=A0A1H0RNA0_9BACI|nr:GNAT family N-acetyltransferase [Litchfieldia salsa]SDP30829.1 Acetyltransferase (GNAT) family protein [Litchfieldia salsa]
MYKKEFYVFEGSIPKKAIIRNYTTDDFEDLIRIQQETFPPPFPSELWWNKNQLSNHIELFPEGALCVEVDGVLCGSMTGLRVDYAPQQPNHTWVEITDNGYITNHSATGNTLYIVDISISPKYRSYGLGKWLMQSMYEVVVYLGIERLLGGGRISGYHRYAETLTAQQYVNQVLIGKLKDPVITFLLRCGRTPVHLVADYLEDNESSNYALLMEWKNPFK